MNAAVGIFGVIGFFLVDIFFLVRKPQAATDRLSIRRTKYYWPLIGVLSILVYVVSTIFGVNDAQAEIFPLDFTSPTFFEAGRAIAVGAALYHLLKERKAISRADIGVENTPDARTPLGLWKTFQIWRKA